MKRPMGWLHVLLICDVHIDIGTTLNFYSVFMLVVWCWAVQCRDITGSAGSCKSRVIELLSHSGSSPVFLECTSVHVLAIYKLDNEAEGSTRNKNPRSHIIEPKHEECRFYIALRVSMEHRSHCLSCLTNLVYSNRCYMYVDRQCLQNQYRSPT